MSKIKTAEQLGNLPVGSVIVDAFDIEGNAPVVACKGGHGSWDVMGSPRQWTNREIMHVQTGKLVCVYQPGDAND